MGRYAHLRGQSFGLPDEIVTLALVDATLTDGFAASFFGFFTSLRLFCPLAMTVFLLPDGPTRALSSDYRRAPVIARDNLGDN